MLLIIGMFHIHPSMSLNHVSYSIIDSLNNIQCFMFSKIQTIYFYQHLMHDNCFRES